MSVSKLPAEATYRRGELPSTAVNLAYLATKQITPEDTTVENISSGVSGNINSYLRGLYFAGWNGALQGGPKITDKDLYVTDKYYNGDLSKPLFFVAKSRYWHEEYPYFANGQEYTMGNIKVTELDGSEYSGSYEIYVEPYADYMDANGFTYAYDTSSPPQELDKIPYRVIVYLDSDRTALLTYDKILSDLTESEAGRTETLNPYPYFTKGTLIETHEAYTDEPIYSISERGGEYTVNVPAEVIIDDRRFEYFYWRIKGKLGRAIPEARTEDAPNLPEADADLDRDHILYQEPCPISEVEASSILNVGIVSTNTQYAKHQNVFWFLESSPFNISKVRFENPLQSDHSDRTRKTGDYWCVNEEDIDSSETGLSNLDMFDLLIVPIFDSGDFEYRPWWDEWSHKSNKGLIFVFDHTVEQAEMPNLDTTWGLWWDNTPVDMDEAYLTRHDLITGYCAPHQLSYQPCLPVTTNPYVESPVSFLWNEGSILTSSNPDHFESLISVYSGDSPVEESSVAGVYDDRIIALDPFSVISFLGMPRIVDNELYNYETSRHSFPEFYGLESQDSDDIVSDFIIRTTHMKPALKMLYNCIMYLTGLSIELIDTYREEEEATTYKTISAQTPNVRSWITTRDSVSQNEFDNEPSFVMVNGLLMRKLFSANPGEILKSWVVKEKGVHYLSLGDVEAEVEIINNPRVKLYQDGNTYYVYTSYGAGTPFESGIAYPTNWVRSNEWQARKKLSGGDFSINLYSVEERQVNKFKLSYDIKNVTKTGVRKVLATPPYPLHTASWNVQVVDSGAPLETTYTATAQKPKVETVETGVIVPNDTTFLVYSREQQAHSKTAYAWLYLPQCDLNLIKLGSTGPVVKYWQEALSKLGYYSGSIDGKFGNVMYNAVTSFQEAHDHILVHGIIGPETGGRIAEACADAGIFLSNHYGYISINNLCKSREGTYGRRTNPFGTSYYESMLLDFIQVIFSTPQDIHRLECKGFAGPTNNIPFTITRVTLFDSETNIIYQQSPNIKVEPGQVTNISFGETIEGVEIVEINVKSDTPYFTHSKWGSSAYYWGMEYIEVYGMTENVSDDSDETEDFVYEGSLLTYPGAVLTVNLPNETEDGLTLDWSDENLEIYSICPGYPYVEASVVEDTSGASWSFYDGRSLTEGVDGPVQTCTLTAQDGLQLYTIKLPSTYTYDQMMVLIPDTDAETYVGFHNGSKFIEGPIEMRALTTATPNRVVIGVLVTEPGLEPRWTDTEYLYNELDVIELCEIVTEDIEFAYVTSSIDFTGQDPPPAYYAYKPYSVLQRDGRQNIRVYKPDSGLNAIDAWYPRITFGSFTVVTTLDENTNIGWQSNCYQQTIEAVYEIPEFEWNAYGDFITEYIEEPLTYVGPLTVKTKRAPLLFSEALDGRTDLTIYSDGSPSTYTDADIEDISKDGTITLAAAITSDDLLTGTYYTRTYAREIVGLDLNPYPGHVLTVDGVDYETYQKIGLPVYIYLLPAYCRLQSSGVIITDSVETQVIKFTTNPDIFDSSSDYYNKLAVLIAVVGCTAPISPTDVTLLDARSRGGGYPDNTTNALYDTEYFSQKAYPERGFLIFDISMAYKDEEDLIKTAISNNIPTGTIYKIRWV